MMASAMARITPAGTGRRRPDKINDSRDTTHQVNPSDHDDVSFSRDPRGVRRQLPPGRG